MNEQSTIRAVLFDLDGTLVQTRDSSWQLFRQTNEVFSLGLDSQSQYLDLFKENFFEAMHRHCESPAVAEAAQAHFLELMRHEYLPEPVPGMVDLVRHCAQHYPLVIVSSNAIAAIRRITDRAGITTCFSQVFGGDVVRDKRDVFRRILADPSYATLRLDQPWYEERPVSPLMPEEVVMVTDTVGDVRHAHECGLRVLGVSWGLHEEDKLRAAGAESVSYWPQELEQLLTGAEP